MILVAEKLGAGGVDMLKDVGEVDCSYDLTPEDLMAKVATSDALVIRSATKASKAAVLMWADGQGPPSSAHLLLTNPHLTLTFARPCACLCYTRHPCCR